MITKIEKEGITIITQIYEGIHGIYVAEYKGDTLIAQYGFNVDSDKDLSDAEKEFHSKLSELGAKDEAL